KRMVVIRSPSPKLVPFKLHQFGKQRRKTPTWVSRWVSTPRITSALFLELFMAHSSKEYALPTPYAGQDTQDAAQGSY
ncbi:hypothetical protein ACK4A1_08850, partial [Aeromonas veronii]